MKLKLPTAAALAALLGITTASAVPDLKIEVQCEDVILSWPSSDTNNEYYLIQHRPNLNPTSRWETIVSWLPSDTGTNFTHYVHVGAVQNPSCQHALGGRADISPISSLDTEIMAAEEFEEPSEVPLVIRADGTGSLVPLMLYPPGFDLSPFLIIDPISGEALSGNGLMTGSSNFTTFDAGMNPGDERSIGFYRVVRQGVNIIGLTNGMTISGTKTFAVEVGSEAGILQTISIREDGTTVGNSAKVAPFSGSLTVTLDTTVMSNGVHQLSGFGSWASGGETSGWDAESEIVEVNIQNDITFPDWLDHFGELYDSLLLAADTIHSNADWYIDIYGANAGYIGTFGGHTSSGKIHAYWDLVGPPPTFTVYNNEPYFDFVFEIIPAESAIHGAVAAASSSTAIKRSYRQTDNWTSKGMWVVANQQAWNNLVGHDTLDIASDGFALMAEGFGLTVRPTRTSGQSYRIGYGESISESIRNGQWANLRQALYHPESRNFFYLGHGSPSAIGASQSTNRMISASEIAANLHTIPAGQTNRHGYRFVFLFGCETASGTLPESFGIVHKENVDSLYYADAGLTPATFVGWNHQQSAGFAGSSLLDNANFIQHFQYEWLSSGTGVNESLNRAKNNYLDVGFINRNKLKVFGNWDLRPLSFNR